MPPADAAWRRGAPKTIEQTTGITVGSDGRVRQKITDGGYKRGQVRDLAGRHRDLSQAYGNHHEMLRTVTWMQHESKSLTYLRAALGDYTILLGPGHGAKRGGPASDRFGVEGRELLTHTNRLSRATGCGGSRSVPDFETWKMRFGQPYNSDWSKWRSSNYVTTRPWDAKDYGWG